MFRRRRRVSSVGLSSGVGAGRLDDPVVAGHLRRVRTRRLRPRAAAAGHPASASASAVARSVTCTAADAAGQRLVNAGHVRHRAAGHIVVR